MNSPVGASLSGRHVALEHVTCVFRHRQGRAVLALDDVSFAVPNGQFVCIVGPSGHGKTTLLRVVAGLQSTTSGDVVVDSRRVDGPGRDRAMVFQQDTVFPWMHVRDNVEFGLRARGLSRSARRMMSERWLAAVGLAPFADSWPRELSEGMRKRVALASVLAIDASVWLMDESFGSLDYFTRRTLQELLLELWNQTNKTVLFVTHDIEEALILADRIILVHGGRLVEDIDVRLPRPRDEDVRASPRGVEYTKTILRRLRQTYGRAEGDETAKASVTVEI